MTLLPATPRLLDAEATATCLPWQPLANAIAQLLQDDSIQVPARTVVPLAGGASLFAMPAASARVAMTKLITFTPANAGTGRPTIQGDVVVFDMASGERRLVLDGPTVTARRTAAVSLLAAQRLAPVSHGPLLVVGAGVQGLAHVQAFVECLGVREVWVTSRSPASAEALARQARLLGAQARVVATADEALPHCPLVVTCTPATAVVVNERPRLDAFVAAVGAFTPHMVELAPAVCQHMAAVGQVVVDSTDAAHEAGDLLRAGLSVDALPTLAQVVRNTAGSPGAGTRRGPVLFKSCGWAGWDLAAAQLALHPPGA